MPAMLPRGRAGQGQTRHHDERVTAMTQPLAWHLVAVGEVGVLLCRPDDERPVPSQVTDCYRALVSPTALATRPGVVLDVVPAATTVLVHHRPGSAAAALSRAWVSQQLARRAPSAGPEGTGDPVAVGERVGETVDAGGHVGMLELPVTYDGDDLAEVARLTGLGADGVVAAHSATLWTVAFTGFAPGFGYLVPAAPSSTAMPSSDVAPSSEAIPSSGALAALLAVPRRAEPRVRVPGGAVALAGGYSGVYPRSGPGGWQLLGRTTAAVWHLDRDPPALLRPGRTVRFVPVIT
jgi:allophanate hydrolase subunit 1